MLRHSVGLHRKSGEEYNINWLYYEVDLSFIVLRILVLLKLMSVHKDTTYQPVLIQLWPKSLHLYAVLVIPTAPSVMDLQIRTARLATMLFRQLLTAPLSLSASVLALIQVTSAPRVTVNAMAVVAQPIETVYLVVNQT